MPGTSKKEKSKVNSQKRTEASQGCAGCQTVPATAPPAPARRRRTWLQTLAAVPAVVLPLLPSAACPACLAAYAGVLSALGLGFILNEQILAPVIAVFLIVGIVTVAWSMRSHRHPGPAIATVAGALLVAAGQLIWDVPVALYTGVGLRVASSRWNLWLKRPQRVRLVQIQPRPR